MKNKIILLLLVVLLTGCLDRSTSINICEAKNLQYYKTTVGCDTICINTETGEKHIYDGSCKIVYGG